VQELGGSTATQVAKLANRNIPYHGRHAQFTNGGWLGAGILFFPLFSVSLVFFESSTKSAISVFRDCYLGTDCKLVTGQ